MSVYTEVSPEMCQAWLQRYDLGQMHSLEPIAAGIENTNYFLTTTTGRYVLTLYERVAEDRLTFSLKMMQVLANNAVLCPEPKVDREGRLFSALLDKPAAIATRIRGQWQAQPTQAMLIQAAENLARMHQAASTWSEHFPNPRSVAWRDETADAVRPFLTSEQLALLNLVLESQRKSELNYLATLPQGAIHADYFHDNVLFEDSALTGVIDFGFAGCDAYAYDLAIAVNDWCWSRDHHALEDVLYRAFIAAYTAIRPLSPMEKTLWPWLLERAALRFWLSRLFDLHLPRPGALVHAHDPMHFERILRYHREGWRLEQGALND